MEKFNIDNYNIENEDTTCPRCNKKRYWLAFYGGEEVFLRCRDCNYEEEI